MTPSFKHSKMTNEVITVMQVQTIESEEGESRRTAKSLYNWRHYLHAHINAFDTDALMIYAWAKSDVAVDTDTLGVWVVSITTGKRPQLIAKLVCTYFNQHQDNSFLSMLQCGIWNNLVFKSMEHTKMASSGSTYSLLEIGQQMTSRGFSAFRCNGRHSVECARNIRTCSLYQKV